MSNTKKLEYFWNLKDQNFGGKRFGEEITGFFVDKDGNFKDEPRLKKLIELGKIVTSEPVDFDHAQQEELNALRKEVEKLQGKVDELEKQAKKSGSVKLKEARAKIVELEKQLDEATKPAGQ